MNKPLLSKLLVVVALATIALTTMPSQAANLKTLTARYDLAMHGFTGSRHDSTCIGAISATPAYCALKPVTGDDQSLDFGGVTIPSFQSTGVLGTAKLIEVRGKDDNDVLGTGFIWVNACQDTDGDNTCGEQADGVTQMIDEPNAFGCVTASKGIKLLEIDPKIEVLVFVEPVRGCPRYIDDTDSQASATAGTVTGIYQS